MDGPYPLMRPTTVLSGARLCQVGPDGVSDRTAAPDGPQGEWWTDGWNWNYGVALEYVLVRLLY